MAADGEEVGFPELGDAVDADERGEGLVAAGLGVVEERPLGGGDLGEPGGCNVGGSGQPRAAWEARRRGEAASGEREGGGGALAGVGVGPLGRAEESRPEKLLA